MVLPMLSPLNGLTVVRPWFPSPIPPVPRKSSPLLYRTLPIKPLICYNASLTASNTPIFTIKSPSILTGATRTMTTLFALACAVSKILLAKLGFAVPRAAIAMSLRSAGPLFFAAMRETIPGKLNSPLAVVAAGMTKWLDIYSSVLLIRVLLSWFPNIPWDRQPFSAMRDLCDPYLSLFRNIIPPVFDTLDVSPILAFTILGVLNMILDSNLGAAA